MADIPDILNIAGVVVSSAILAYVGFWALRVRRALLVRVYRSEALGTALIVIFLALTEIVGTTAAYLYGGGAFGVFNGAASGGFGLFFAFLLVLFFWVDSSVRAVKRSDPRARDTFHWSKLRIVLWAFSLPGQILIYAVTAFGLITLGVAATSTGSAPSGGLIGLVLEVILTGAIAIPIASAAVMLPIIARRTADMTFRSQLLWFGAFGISYLIICNQLGQTIGLFPSQWYNLFFGYLGLAVCGYCLYRSVSSLVPGSTTDTSMENRAQTVPAVPAPKPS